jgi:hypothetical protein
MPAVIGFCIHIRQAPEEADAMVTELFQRISQRVLGGPARCSEQFGRASRAECDQPVTPVGRRSEYRIGSAQAAESDEDVGGVGLRNVAPHQRHAAITSQRAAHATAQIAVTLANALNADRQADARTVWRSGQDDIEAAAGFQVAQQGGQGGHVEAKGRSIPDVPRQPTLHRAQAWRSGEDDDGVPHP